MPQVPRPEYEVQIMLETIFSEIISFLDTCARGGKFTPTNRPPPRVWAV